MPSAAASPRRESPPPRRPGSAFVRPGTGFVRKSGADGADDDGAGSEQYEDSAPKGK
jgi:hypothetical protein